MGYHSSFALLHRAEVSRGQKHWCHLISEEKKTVAVDTTRQNATNKGAPIRA